MFSHAFILGFLDFVVSILFLSSFYHSNQCWLSVCYEQSVRFQEEDHDIIKGLYATCSSWHIDPWNNREVWVDNIVCHHAFSSPIVRIAKIHAYLLRVVRGTYAAIAEHVLYLAFLNITSLLPAIHLVIYGRAVFR